MKRDRSARGWIVAALALTLVAAGGAAARAGCVTSSADIVRSLGAGGGLPSVESAQNCPSRGLRRLPDAPETAAPTAATGGPVIARPAAMSAANHAPRTTTPTPAARAEAPSVSLTVEFATGSTALTPQAVDQLRELGTALRDPGLSGARFRIVGHTDTVGTREGNRSLSEHRAAAVVDYLVREFGLDAARLQAVGRGEDDLAVPTAPQVDEPRNRRVEVVRLGA